MSSRISETPVSDYNIYTGVWFDHARGRPFGGRLTLERSQGAILIAFLALYVAVAGSGIWKIARLLLHRHFSSPSTADGIHLQRQAILRNSETALTAAWDTLQISLAWKSARARNNFRRLLPVTGISILLSLAIAASGILSSRVIHSASPNEGGNLVLIAGKDCRSAVWGKVEDASKDQQTQAYLDFLAQSDQAWHRGTRALADLSYQLRCYQNGLDGANCGVYPKTKLPYTFTNVAPCPFSRNLCTSENNTLVLDTGLLKSAVDLGFNGDPSFQVRQTRACSPLKADRFKSTVDDDTVVDGEDLEYFYPQSPDNTEQRRLMVRVPYPKSPDFNGEESSYSVDRRRNYRTAVAIPGTADVELEPGYVGGRASFILLEPSNLFYLNASSDPWFSINTPYPNSTYSMPLYVADEPLNFMGCVTTNYVCNPHIADTSKNCFKYDPELGFNNSLTKLWPQTRDRAIVQGALRFLPSYEVFNPDIYFQLPGSPSLDSQRRLTGWIESDFIGVDRWQTEMRFAFEASLASLQAQMVRVASGDVMWNPAGSGRDTQFVGEACEPLEICQTACERQLIRSPGYLSFSLFGVISILVFGFVFILAGLCIEWIVFTIERVSRGGIKSFAEIEWEISSVLQLQRLGYEAAGFGSWSGTDGGVPITDSGEMLGALDTTDIKHARLVRQGSRDGDLSREATVHDAFLHEKRSRHKSTMEEMT